MRKVFLLDFDNTMVGTEHGNIYVFKGLMNDLFGHYLLPDDYDHLTCQSWKNIFDYLAGKYGKGTITGEDMRIEFVSRKTLYFEKHTPEKAQGLETVLSLPVKKAIVTGSSRVELEIFRNVIDFSLFDAIVTDDDIVNGKPAPEPYLKALGLLNADASDALAVEDSRMGITSARSAGIFTVFSRQFANEDHSSLADMTVDNLIEICS